MLHCSNTVHRGLLLRLQAIGAAEQRTQAVAAARPRGFDRCTLQSLRNVRVDGRRVPPEALTMLDRIVMPQGGVVTFDFVSFAVCSLPCSAGVC